MSLKQHKTHKNMATSATNNTQKIENHQRTKQLTTLTVLMLTMLTVLIQMPSQSTAASIFDAKKISSTAAATLTVLDVNSDALSNSIPSVLQQLAESGDNGHRVRRKRLRKRHNANMRLSELAAKVNDDDVRRTPPEWVNACGGQEVVPHMARARRAGRSKHVRKQLNLLTKSLRYENSTLTSLHKIVIDDIGSWHLYSKKYSFLPSLKRNATIKLRYWHRDMQKFVASFAELGVKQYRWDQAKRQHTSELTRELNSLLLSAKRVLCEVENAFNATHPQAKLPIIAREEMQKRLNFYAKDEKSVAESGVKPVDLKYAKQRYSKYMQNMFHALRRRLRRTKKIATKAAAKSVSSSSVTAENSSRWAELAQLLNDSESAPLESASFVQAESGASNELLDVVKA